MEDLKIILSTYQVIYFKTNGKNNQNINPKMKINIKACLKTDRFKYNHGKFKILIILVWYN